MAIQVPIELPILTKAQGILKYRGQGQLIAEKAQVDYRRISQIKTGKRNTLMEEEHKRFTDYINKQPDLPAVQEEPAKTD